MTTDFVRLFAIDATLQNRKETVPPVMPVMLMATVWRAPAAGHEGR